MISSSRLCVSTLPESPDALRGFAALFSIVSFKSAIRSSAKKDEDRTGHPKRKKAARGCGPARLNMVRDFPQMISPRSARFGCLVSGYIIFWASQLLLCVISRRFHICNYYFPILSSRSVVITFFPQLRHIRQRRIDPDRRRTQYTMRCLQPHCLHSTNYPFPFLSAGGIPAAFRRFTRPLAGVIPSFAISIASIANASQLSTRS